MGFLDVALGNEKAEVKENRGVAMSGNCRKSGAAASACPLYAADNPLFKAKTASLRGKDETVFLH